MTLKSRGRRRRPQAAAQRCASALDDEFIPWNTMIRLPAAWGG